MNRRGYYDYDGYGWYWRCSCGKHGGIGDETQGQAMTRYAQHECPRPLLDTELAALMLNVSPRRVRQLTADGTLTNHGTRYKMLYRYDDVAAIVETRKPKT